MTPFDGDMDDYRALLASRGGNGPKAANGAAEKGKKERRREAARQRKEAQNLKRGLARADAEVEKLEGKKEDLTQAIADPVLYRDEGDSAKLAALQKELEQVEKDLSAAEDRWAEVQETWDAANA